MNLILTRKFKSVDKSFRMPQTLGELKFVEGEQTIIFKTLESFYFKNLKKVSCVTPGIYEWKKIKPNNKIPFPHIQIITDRPDVTIRAGMPNLNLAGAIVVGYEHAYNETYDLMQVDDSKQAFKDLMALLPDSGTIEIRDEKLTARGCVIRKYQHLPLTTSLQNFWYDDRVVPS